MSSPSDSGAWTVVTTAGVQPVLVGRQHSTSISFDGEVVPVTRYIASVRPHEDLFRVGDTEGTGDSAHEAVMDLIAGGTDRGHGVWPVLQVIPPGAYDTTLARTILSHAGQSDDALRALLSVAGWFVAGIGTDGTPRYTPAPSLTLHAAAAEVVRLARASLPSR